MDVRKTKKRGDPYIVRDMLYQGYIYSLTDILRWRAQERVRIQFIYYYFFTVFPPSPDL